MSIEQYIKFRDFGKSIEEIQKEHGLSEATAYALELGYQCFLQEMPLERAIKLISTIVKIDATKTRYINPLDEAEYPEMSKELANKLFEMRKPHDYKPTTVMQKFLYRAQRMTDGKFVIGSLLHIPNSPFTYIATVEAMNNMCVNELDRGKTTNLELTRVMLKSVEPYENKLSF
jgi:uncharacterized HAD superfamily protein